MQPRRENAYNFLYDQIVNYKIKPGASITEADIANTLHISRTPVREALSRLEADGLVKRTEGRGFFAADISEEDVEEICFLRRTLEIVALRKSFREISREEILAHRERMYHLDENEWSEEYYTADREFHKFIVEKSGYQRLIRFVNTLNALVDRFRRIAGFNQKRPSETRKEHIEIIEAILDGDEEKACTLLNNHLCNVEENIKTVYRQWFFL